MRLTAVCLWLVAGTCWRKSVSRGRRSAAESLLIKRFVKFLGLSLLIHWCYFEELIKLKAHFRWLWLLDYSILTSLNSKRLGLRRFVIWKLYLLVLVGFEVSVLNIFTDKDSCAGLLCLHHHGLLWRRRYVSLIWCFGV
jgi:hypothetical protein